MGFISDLLISIAQKTSWERVFFPEPDKTKQLEKLAEIIPKAPPKLPVAPTLAGTTIEQISPQDMLTYQKKELYGQLWLLQNHLNNGSRIDGKPCDCAEKHSIAVAALAAETEPMDSNHLWTEIKDFSYSILPKVQVEEIIRGSYASEYPEMAKRARELRKRIELGIAPLSLEEAKAEAAKLATEEVEARWNSQEKI